MFISDQLIDQVWSKGRQVKGYPSSIIRQDACGAWIRRDCYGNYSSPFGWEIDHIFPQKKLLSLKVPQQEIDYLKNLRPMQWKNNISKATDYPSYRAVVTSEGVRNVESVLWFTVSRITQDELGQLYDKYLK